MTGLVVKTVIICTLKFLKNGVCFVLIWQHHWKMSLSIRRATFAERLSPSDFCRATFAERLSPFLARPLTLTSSSPSLPFLTSRRATFVNNAVLQSVLHWREQWRLSRAEQSDRAMSLPSFLTIRSAVVSATRSAVVSAILSAVVSTREQWRLSRAEHQNIVARHSSLVATTNARQPSPNVLQSPQSGQTF